MDNMNELNLNEMEMITGGDATAQRMFDRGCKGAAAGIGVGACLVFNVYIFYFIKTL